MWLFFLVAATLTFLPDQSASGQSSREHLGHFAPDAGLNDIEVFAYATAIFDEHGSLTEETQQGWSGTEWQNSRHYLYAYDDSGNLTKEINQSWTEARWENVYLTLYSLDESGKPDGNTRSGLERDGLGKQAAVALHA